MKVPRTLATENHLATKCDFVWMFVFQPGATGGERESVNFRLVMFCIGASGLDVALLFLIVLNDKKDRFHDDLIDITDISWVLDVTE